MNTTTIDTNTLPAVLLDFVKSPKVSVYRDGERIVLIPHQKETNVCPILGMFKSNKNMVDELQKMRAENEGDI
jgi:virulence-associated protein VagC